MSQGSMSVNSLIDKFSNSDSSTSTDSSKQTPHQKASGQEKKIEIEKTGLLSLLGPNVTSFPYSEQAYIESIKLRTEQEKTKQDFYRLEIANKNLAIVQTALKAQIPVNLIPLMCVGNSPDQQQRLQQQLEQQVRLQVQPEQYQPQQKTPPESSFQVSHSRSGSSKELLQSDVLNANPVPPINYRFGGGPPTLNRRPLSPAKIGAAAVANLAAPTTPYRITPGNRKANRIVPSHQRHFSMPVESITPSKHKPNPNIDFNRSEAQLQAQNRFKSPCLLTTGSAMLNPPLSSSQNQLQSPLGVTPTIQVKPSPAQPLHKQSRSSQPPSQESMTSFQHIIQFHHWKPESSNAGQASGSGGNPFRQQPHKRHKSTSENMSVDLTPTIPETSSPEIRITNDDNELHSDDHDDNDIDITMDDDTITDMNPIKNMIRTDSNISDNKSEASQQSNIGRYPHDILSPSNS